MAWQCRIDNVGYPTNESVLIIRASYYDDAAPAVDLFQTVLRVGPDDTVNTVRARLIEIGKDARRIVQAKAVADAWVNQSFAIP